MPARGCSATHAEQGSQGEPECVYPYIIWTINHENLPSADRIRNTQALNKTLPIQTNDESAQTDQRTRYFSSVLLPASLLGGLLIIALIIQFFLSWQAHRRMVPINEHLTQMTRLQNANLALQKELLDTVIKPDSFTSKERQRLHDEIKSILEIPAYITKDTRDVLTRAHQVLQDKSRSDKEALIDALNHTRLAMALETRAHHQLLESVNRATRLELQIGIVSLIVFPFGALLILFTLRRRIFAPLNQLGTLMSLLGRRDYAPAQADSDPILHPLMENYNSMVTRLAALERDHASRENELESQVSYATRTLLEQQRSLANTERLAAVGETMARIAHELRNPLAGVKLASTNLRSDMHDTQAPEDYIERLDIIVAEINRIIDVLNSLLLQSRHTPEPVKDINLKKTITDLVALLQYQLVENTRIRYEIADDLVIRLPEAMLSQALLNLILNANDAIAANDGEIFISARVEANTLKLMVSDDGPGFPDDLISSGIQSFVTHRSEGTGLGLSMVQRFAHAHSGKIHLSNRPDGGACVTLEFPYEVNDV